MLPDCEVQALSPPSEVRQASKAMASPRHKAPRRSRAACVRALAFTVKKSTMMLPRVTWHQGMNRAIAAPAARPVSSKSPTSVVPVVLRPIRLTHVMRVMTVRSAPARTAHSLASFSNSFTRRSCAGDGFSRRVRPLPRTR